MEAQITIPGPVGIPIAAPSMTKIHVVTTKEIIERILALSSPNAAFTSSQRSADQTRKNASTWTVTKSIE